MNMVEKVAISQSDFDGRSWLAMSRNERDRYKARARAAIEAMKTPTEAMSKSGKIALNNNGVELVTDDDAPVCWESMIDAALNEPLSEDDGEQ